MEWQKGRTEAGETVGYVRVKLELFLISIALLKGTREFTLYLVLTKVFCP